MTGKRTSVFENALIWFGAGVSLAEIMTGTFLAPLGFSQGLLSIIIGHVIGCFLLFLAGCMGGKRRMSAMETVTLSFGSKGAFLFAMLNVLQLVGWTAIMIYDGALAANGALPCGHWIWAVVIGGLIIVWLIIGIKSLGKVNLIAMSALFILTVVLSFLIFRRGDLSAAAEGGLSFGAAIELNVAMPLSLVHNRTGLRFAGGHFGYRGDNAERGPWDSRPDNHRSVNCDDYVPRCLFSRYFQ